MGLRRRVCCCFSLHLYTNCSKRAQESAKCLYPRNSTSNGAERAGGTLYSFGILGGVVIFDQYGFFRKKKENKPCTRARALLLFGARLSHSAYVRPCVAHVSDSRLFLFLFFSFFFRSLSSPFSHYLIRFISSSIPTTSEIPANEEYSRCTLIAPDIRLRTLFSTQAEKMIWYCGKLSTSGTLWKLQSILGACVSERHRMQTESVRG